LSSLEINSVKRVALNIGDAKLADGSRLKFDGQLAGTPSVLFDAIAVILSEEDAALLSKEAAAMDFVRDAFGHLKAIGVDKGGAALLKKAGIKQGAGVKAIGAVKCFIATAKTRQWKREASVQTLALFSDKVASPEAKLVSDCPCHQSSWELVMAGEQRMASISFGSKSSSNNRLASPSK
jgi:hypothetical protein